MNRERHREDRNDPGKGLKEGKNEHGGEGERIGVEREEKRRTGREGILVQNQTR